MEHDETLSSESASEDAVSGSVPGSVAQAAAMLEAGLEAGLVTSSESKQPHPPSSQSQGEQEELAGIDDEAKVAEASSESSPVPSPALMLPAEPSASMKIRHSFEVPANAVSVALDPELLPLE